LQAALEGEPDPWFDLQESQVDMRQFEAISV
jgi:nitrite reductase (NADH) large subunit